MSFFDVLNNVTSSKEYIYTPELEADILVFMLNRGASNFLDCVLHANELNIRQNLTKKQVYDYYHFAITPKKKRFSKWAKPDKDARLEVIKSYYQCNVDVAEQYSKVISDEDFKNIQERMNKGGRG
jgi:hypothetical protein